MTIEEVRAVLEHHGYMMQMPEPVWLNLPGVNTAGYEPHAAIWKDRRALAIIAQRLLTSMDEPTLLTYVQGLESTPQPGMHIPLTEREL